MTCKERDLVFGKTGKPIHLKRRVGLTDCTVIFLVGGWLPIGEVLLDQCLIRQRAPSVLSASDENARAIQARIDLGSKNAHSIL
ncbi:hypothetical protein D3C75_1116230 [compost metagenome]